MARDDRRDQPARMFLAITGAISGFVLGGVPGLAVGAVAFACLGLMARYFEPPGERVTLHERHMRRNRRYRARFEATQQERARRASGYGFGR